METSRSRPRARPTARASGHARIRGLSCFDEIHKKILEGWPAREVAKYIQEEAGELEDSSHESVTTMVKRYRESLPPAELAKHRLPVDMQRAQQKVAEGIDELKELENLYRLQMERIHIDFALEKKFNKLIPATAQEVRAAREILSTIAELKMDLGLHERHLGRIDGDAEVSAVVMARVGDEKIAAVLSNSEKRQRLLGIAKQLVGKSEKPEIIDVVAEEPEGKDAA